MKIQLSLYDIKQAYYGLKQLAIKSFHLGDLKTALFYLHHCSVIAQQFNWIYSDEEMERLLQQISKRLFGDKLPAVKTNSNRVMLIDDFCVSFILALQYIDALIASGREVVYVTHGTTNVEFNGEIVSKLKDKKGVDVIVIKEDNDVVQYQRKVYKAIVEYAPSQILLHLYSHSNIIPVLYALPKTMKSYLINLGDQLFWLGAKAVDYVIEFRQFGVSLSQQYRGIKPEQQLLIPFYPIVDGNPFQGFPEECTEKGKVLIFSGGDIYKVLDEKRMYWHLVKRLLDTFPEVVFLFATKGDRIGMDFLNGFIKDNHFEGRFIYTKFRPDIDQVLAHADIYMGTCPASGSLMSQLAARNGTPILQYYYPGTQDDETEQSICVNDNFQISYQDEEAFMKEADKLIRNKSYRDTVGTRLQNAMISVNQFNAVVDNSLNTNTTQIALKPFVVNNDILVERWFALEKAGFVNTMPYLYSTLGWYNTLRYAPALFIKKNVNRILKLFNRKNFEL